MLGKARTTVRMPAIGQDAREPSMEMELKLLLGPASRALVESHPAFHDARRRDRRHEVTTYFDTPDLLLHGQGASLRVRDRGGSFVQTVKVSRRDDALGLRSEWEWPVASAEVDRAALASPPEGLAFLREAVDRLEPKFETDIARDTWLIRLDGHTEVEAVIDTGTIRAGSRSTAVSEVELELKGGPVAPLFGLALELVERADLRYGPRSKAERGYDLVRGTAASAPALEAAELHDKATLGQAFPRLVAAALRDMAAEIPAALQGEVEGIHRMRAAIRKLRTLLVLFAPHIEPEAADRFNAALREIGAVLGAGRDWDVFLTETLAGARDEIEAAGIDLLAPAAEGCRTQAHAAVAQLLDGPLPTRLILGMGAWTAGSEWAAGSASDAPLRDLLPHLLDRVARKVRKRGRRIVHEGAEHLHALRKAMKKLRYSTEDVAPLYGAKAVRRYVKALKSALSLLGDINDASVTRARLDEIAPPDRPDLAGPAAALLVWTEERRTAALAKLGHKWHDVARLEPFWR
jgi:inorganic triphosphatase YgiF